MTLVEQALRSQRKSWQEIVERISSGHFTQNLPPKAPLRILLFGVGSSYFAAKLTALSLIRESMRRKERSRIPVIACSSVGVGVEVVPQKGDWVFVFSHRGKSEVTLRALEMCAQVGAFTILVTAKEGPDVASARLHVHTSDLEKCEPHTVGLTSAICAVTTLLLGSTAAKAWEALSAQPDPDLKLLEEKASKVPVFLIGEWEGEWIAREISLKLIEMAQLRTSVFSSEEFFHGPHALWSALGSKDPIWFVSVANDSRNKEIQAAHKSVVSPTNLVSWVSSLVELQWLALAVALKLGKDPDGIKPSLSS